MLRLGALLLGFLLVIVGMVMFGFAPGLGRLLVVGGALLVWGGLARALEAKPWSAPSRRLLHVVLGASVLAVAASAIAPDLMDIIVASAFGGMLGAFAPEWVRRFSSRP